MKYDIFEFNHTDSLLSEEEVKTLKRFYKYFTKTFGVSRKPSNISRLLMNQLLSLEFYW